MPATTLQIEIPEALAPTAIKAFCARFELEESPANAKKAAVRLLRGAIDSQLRAEAATPDTSGIK